MLRLLALSLVILIVLCVSQHAAFAQRASFTVGTATAAAGQKATGYLQVPAGVDAATNIPVIVVNGAKPGPVLALVSGAHGTEYASIIALEKLIPALDPAADFPAPWCCCRWSTFLRSCKRCRTSIPSTRRA